MNTPKKSKIKFLNLNLLIMKNNYVKLGLLALMLMAGTANAQQTTGDYTKQGDNLAASATATNTSVKLIDNKGTIKYLQAANGLTSITNTTADKTLTTWQLGGELTADTYIDVDGKVFGLDGIELVNTATSSASIDATDQSDHGSGTGWTLLVRNEATGAIQKLMATDLIQSGFADDVSDAGEDASNAIAITATGILASMNRGKIWVYRNGVKLIYGTDFTIADDLVTVTAVANSWELYEGDVLEVQWIK